MKRRTFLTALAAPLTGASPTGTATSAPIVDTHIHLFDPRRPQGVPWPSKSNSLIYRPTLPPHFREASKGLGVTGAIQIECSPWFEDNQWALDVAALDTVIVGVVGNLEPQHPEFGARLERFARNPLFLGIRYGYLWGRNLRAELQRPEFIAGMKLLAGAGLALDTANPSVQLLEDVARLTDGVAGLRVIIDHLPALVPPQAESDRIRWKSALRALSGRENVFAKLSQVLRREGGRVALDAAYYQDRLETIWETFGEDRLMFGSDWPNSKPVADYPETVRIVKEFIGTKGVRALEKCLWQNSVRAYRWKPRESSQPRLAG